MACLISVRHKYIGMSYISIATLGEGMGAIIGRLIVECFVRTCFSLWITMRCKSVKVIAYWDVS